MSRLHMIHVLGWNMSSDFLNSETQWRGNLLYSAAVLIRARYTYTFDKSPDYIRDLRKLQQIATMLPSAKLILLVRNPTSRAYSGIATCQVYILCLILVGFQHNCRHHRYRRLLHSVHVSNVTVPAGDIFNILDPLFQVAVGWGEIKCYIGA